MEKHSDQFGQFVLLREACILEQLRLCDFNLARSVLSRLVLQEEQDEPPQMGPHLNDTIVYVGPEDPEAESPGDLYECVHFFEIPLGRMDPVGTLH